jgi:hypothetical protein
MGSKFGAGAVMICGRSYYSESCVEFMYLGIRRFQGYVLRGGNVIWLFKCCMYLFFVVRTEFVNII